MGYTGPVKSPTYTLIETYEFKALSVHHLDIYRLAEPEELEWLGVRDLFSNRSIALIEWPEKGDGFLPGADVQSDAQRGQGWPPGGSKNHRIADENFNKINTMQQ